MTPANDYDFERNPIRNSLSNRYASGTTIITRCVFHRTQTANNLSTVDELYDTTPASGYDPQGVRDIILRLDGSVKAYDVSNFNTPTTASTPTIWQNQDFR